MRIGGSDWGDILGLEPYGCSRRAFYDKSGVEPDKPKGVTGAMRRGQVLEPVVAEEWVKQSGRLVVPDQGAVALLTEKPVRLPAWWDGKPDYAIVPADGGSWPAPLDQAGVLECKTTNPILFRQDRREARKEHRAQLQTYMSYRARLWGVIFVLEPVNFETAEHVFEHDVELEREMIEVGNEFVAAVGAGSAPPKLAPDDKRCARCIFRQTCQGEDLYGEEDWNALAHFETENEELAEAAVEYLELQQIEAEAKAAKEAARAKIITAIGGEKSPSKKILIPAGPRISWSKFTQTRLDTKLLKKEQPEIAERYLKTTTVGQLRIYP